MDKLDELLHPPKKLLCNQPWSRSTSLERVPEYMVQCCTEHTRTVLRKSSLLAGVLKCTTALAGGRLVNALPGTRIGQADGTISPPWASFKCPREEHSMASRTWPRRGQSVVVSHWPRLCQRGCWLARVAARAIPLLLLHAHTPYPPPASRQVAINDQLNGSELGSHSHSHNRRGLACTV